MRFLPVVTGVSVALTVLAGCGANQAVAPESAASSTASASTEIFDEAKAAQLQQIVADTRTEFGFPGAMVAIAKPNGEWRTSDGFSRPTQTGEIRPATHTRIGSITKTMTVTVLLQLAEQGLVDLATPIGTYVPNVPNGDTATLTSLANMTSGIPTYTAQESFLVTYFSNPETIFSPQQLVDFIAGQPPMFAPGTQMFYSNTNTVLLGMVIEQVTGKPIEQVMSEKIFTPLGMGNTLLPGDSPDLPIPFWQGITTQGLPENAQKDATFWNPSWTFTAGEAISNLDDLIIWAKALATGEGLLGAEMQSQRLASLQSAVPPNTPELSYGLGFAQENGWIGHAGELPGYNTVVRYLPATQTTLVVMVNSDIGRNDESPAGAVADRLIAAGI